MEWNARLPSPPLSLHPHAACQTRAPRPGRERLHRQGTGDKRATQTARTE